eukprot:m.313094 g.313094  ORF g.313094 m.313094 type:complete len:51 (+) comp349015_c0_seq1:759-911(+)
MLPQLFLVGFLLLFFKPSFLLTVISETDLDLECPLKFLLELAKGNRIAAK